MLDRHALRLRLHRARTGLIDGAKAAWYGAFMPFWRAEAQRRRERLCGSYIAIAGSVGKSTASMISSTLLKAQAPAYWGYFANNMRHVYRHMRKLDHKVDYFVQEVSEYPRGITAEIGRSMRPQAVLITAIGLDHLTAFKTPEEVGREIGDLVEALGPGGVACLNADDKHVRALTSRTTQRAVLFGRAADAELRVENMETALPNGLRFDLVIGDTRRRVVTRFAGSLLLPSILGPLALIHALGLDLDRAIADLALIEPLETRQRLTRGDDGHTYLVDAYKASYWSTQLLIDDIPNIASGRRILVLGEISDLGNDGSRKLRKLVRQASGICDLVIGTGNSAAAVERVARNEAIANIRPARNLADIAAILAAEPPSLVVIKGRSLLRHLAQLEARQPTHLPSA